MVERKHRHIVELGLATMMHASIPLQFWDYVFESMVYIINRLPSPITAHSTPFQRLFHQKPDYTMLHVLGCSCYPLFRPYNKYKLEPRSEKCIFLGYSTIHKGYYCLHPPTNRMYISRHVLFDENDFPFQLSTPSTTDTSSTPIQFSNQLTVLPSSITSTSTSSPPSLLSPQSLDHSFHLQQPEPPILLPQHTHKMLTRTQTKSLKPKTYPDYHLYSLTSTTNANNIEPTCYTQAVKILVWRQAMATELTALAHNSTWDLVSPPSNAHIIGAKWIFRLKLKAHGSVERHKPD
jgi:hypothetical protein